MFYIINSHIWERNKILKYSITIGISMLINKIRISDYLDELEHDSKRGMVIQAGRLDRKNEYR